MKKTILNLSAIAMLAGTSSAQAFNLEEILIGVGAGLLSKELCKGLGANDNFQAVCAIGGGLLGAEVARQINEQDAMEIQRAQEEAFRGGINSRHDWDGRRRGSNSGYRGDFIVVQEGYHYQTRETCRVLRSEVFYPRNYSNVPSEVKTSTVCRRSNGSVYTLEQTDYFRNGRYTGSQSVETETRGRGPIVLPVPSPLRCEGWSAADLRRNEVVYVSDRGMNVEKGTYQGYNNYNGTVAVKSFGFIDSYSLNDIAIKGCFYGFKTGTKVTYRNDRVTIVGIFRNGDLVIQDGIFFDRVSSRSVYR